MARCARYRDQALAATRSLSVSIFKPEARTLPLTPHAQSGGCGASRLGWVCRLKAWRASSSRRATVFARRPCAVGPKLEERTGPPPHSALRRGPRPHYARPVSATRQRPLSVLVLVPGTPPHGRLVSRLVLRSVTSGLHIQKDKERQREWRVTSGGGSKIRSQVERLKHLGARRGTADCFCQKPARTR